MSLPAHQDERLAAFLAGYDFPLDDFQFEAIGSLLGERSVLVAAPTGAGKTVVGEFAVWQAVDQGGKCFYTTPIKALSNQKFGDLVERYGADRVGLLTGDNVINGKAPVVVMTTEVLRNMLYEASPTLVGLQAVVLDEVHYLADVERGAVWEEVIIQLAPEVQLACLSATVSNAEEFGAWLRSVRETCDVVISDSRPVPLEHHYAFNHRVEPVFRSGGRKAGAGKAQGGRERAARQALGGVPNPEIVMLERRSGKSNRVSRRGRRQPSDVRLRPPRRSALIAEMKRRKWLPAIWFVFSRAGCDKAVAQMMADNVRLTSAEERRRIQEIVAERTADLPPEDLAVLGYDQWRAGLEAGLAAHHAGMVPVFKETVERLFKAGLLKVCFATETLALGINMPARTVVIERLDKWTGQRHEMLTPGQFTQLTGRAGRRGLDTLGHAVVLYQRDTDFPAVAGLVGRRTEPLRSSFAPNYNMAVNLLRRHDREEAEALLASSFAQYQADATVVGDERRIARNHEAIDGYASNLVSDCGEFSEYWALRRELTRLEKAGADSATQERVGKLRAAIREHPVHADPALPDLEVWARRHDDLHSQTQRLERSVRRRTGSLVHQLDRLVGVLQGLGYLTGDEKDPLPTEQGMLLAALYSETDLVLAEAIRRGVLDGLEGPDLAAVLSVFAHETRMKDPPPPVFPTGDVYDAVAASVELWQEIVAREEAASLPPTRALDPGFAEVVWRWAHGVELEDALGEWELTAGDFVRSTKQVADLLRQVRDAAEPPLSDRAGRAARSLVRGVVAYTGL